MKRLLLIPTVLLLLPALTYAKAPTPQQRARAALALAGLSQKLEQGDCGCGGLQPCECGPTCTCGVKAVTQGPPNALENLAYQIALRTALRQNKPLLIWVGETCPNYEQQWPQYVHCRCTAFMGLKSLAASPCVIVVKPDDTAGMTTVGTFLGIPTLAEVQTLLGTRQAAMRPQPVYIPMPQPQFFVGGFGGGGMGGGSGGCSS